MWLWRKVEVSNPERGPWIQAWQGYLAGEGLYTGDYLPFFGPKTIAATNTLRTRLGLDASGEVDESLLGHALSRGFAIPASWASAAGVGAGSPATSSEGLRAHPGYMRPDWPKRLDQDGDGNPDVVYLQDRRMFGDLTWRVFDAQGNVTITNDYVEKNVRTLVVPQLRTLGLSKTGGVRIHRGVAAQLLGLFCLIEEAGLLHLIKSWGGTFVPRLVRGSDSVLSNHAYATAWDWNMAWNGLGRRPALVGEVGEVRRLVPFVETCGAFWGGYFRRSDGMHNEFVQMFGPDEVSDLARRLTPDHAQQVLAASRL